LYAYKPIFKTIPSVASAPQVEVPVAPVPTSQGLTAEEWVDKMWTLCKKTSCIHPQMAIEYLLS
jgi:hypothetical protein